MKQKRILGCKITIFEFTFFYLANHIDKYMYGEKNRSLEYNGSRYFAVKRPRLRGTPEERK